MKSLYKNPTIIVFAVFAIAIFVYFKDQLPAIDLSHLTPGNVVAVLGYLSVIMLVVEQFIEVFIDDPNEKIKVQSKDRLEEINTFFDNLDKPSIINSEVEIIESDAKEIVLLKKEKRKLEEFLITQGLKRERRTIITGFIIGLFLSFSGFRLMSGIIFNGDEEHTLSEVQGVIIQAIDIVLTAGIIAGGSGRVHTLIKRIKTTFLSPNNN
ncbi:hypothetical protein [Aquimarina longa]|uniref:hypothetical protein n=1 Tax=Aquimarina longa TaxID=1080221 RepID=UPI0007835308|nr:hypothetical protein [Aquimarina longa]